MRKHDPEATRKRFRDFCRAMAGSESYSPDAERARAERQAEELAHQRWLERTAWKDSGIPAEYWPFLLEHDDCPAHRLVAGWMESQYRGLLLTGTAGLHKTSAACAAVAKARGRFIRATDLLAAGQFDGEFWDRARLTPLLVIDEMGKEPADGKGWYEGAVYRLLNGRYEDNRRTVIIANVSPVEFRARYMPIAHQALAAKASEEDAREIDPLYDRFRTGWLVPSPLTGSSMRGKGTA